MSRRRTIRAWKDPAFRRRLSAAELAAMPANPAGRVFLDDADLDYVGGATGDPCVNTDPQSTCLPTCVTCVGNTCWPYITDTINPCTC